MPILNRAAELSEEATAWRRHLHAMPELLYDLHRTAAFVAERLREFGCDEVVSGIGRTGVVGIVRGGRGDGPTVGLRADMDALPLKEATGKPYASTVDGLMHACGHDGHTAMLLGAARYLCETRNFAGAVAVIFQPAEEGGAGALAMLEDGLMERFRIARIFGMHNCPGLPLGHFALRPGPIMAATAEFDVTVSGKGGHAAMPHTTLDPIVAASQMVGALQTIASRSIDPLDAVVVSVTNFHAGTTHNVIPDEARLGGTVRSLSADVAERAFRRIGEICAGVAASAGLEADVGITPGYPVTENDPQEAAFAAAVAAEVAGAANVDTAMRPLMGAEDFSFMLKARPGAFVFIGNGDSAPLHSSGYDFNDEAIAHGISFWARLAETALAR